MSNFHKKPSHLRGDSFELDVFDAKRYFSGGMDAITLLGNPLESMREQRGEEEEEEEGNVIEIDRSSEVPKTKGREREKKKWKKPNSPGVKFVNILNSFFHQAGSRRKLKRSFRIIEESTKSVYSFGSNSSGFVAQKQKSEESSVENKWVLNRFSDGYVKKDWILERIRRRGGDGDEAWESDCSSDLFELKNCDLVN